MATCKVEPSAVGQAICWGSKDICMVYKCAWLCAKEPDQPLTIGQPPGKSLHVFSQECTTCSHGLPWLCIMILYLLLALPVWATLALKGMQNCMLFFSTLGQFFGIAKELLPIDFQTVYCQFFCRQRLQPSNIAEENHKVIQSFILHAYNPELCEY